MVSTMEQGRFLRGFSLHKAPVRAKRFSLRSSPDCPHCLLPAPSEGSSQDTGQLCWGKEAGNSWNISTKHKPANIEEVFEKETISRWLPYIHLRKLSGGKIQMQFYLYFFITARNHFGTKAVFYLICCLPLSSQGNGGSSARHFHMPELRVTDCLENHQHELGRVRRYIISMIYVFIRYMMLCKTLHTG